jgi:hypothetical protein
MLNSKQLSDFEKSKSSIISLARQTLSAKCELTDTQLRTLFNKSNATDCLEEITLYIQYQMGKEKGKWGDIGNQLLGHLDGFFQTPTFSDHEYKLYAIRYYFGCLIRYQKYQDYVKKNSRGRKEWKNQ